MRQVLLAFAGWLSNIGAGAFAALFFKVQVSQSVAAKERVSSIPTELKVIASTAFSQ